MKKIVLGSLASLSLLACGPAAAPAQCAADTYPAESYATNAAAELGLRTRLETLIGKAEETGTAGARVTAAELEALYAAGTPSVRAISTEAARAGVSEAFVKLEQASGNTWTPADPPAGTGGLWGAYVYSERGVDLPETVEKLTLGGGHYAQAASLMTDQATAADVDRMLALFGASPSFPMNDKAAVDPDQFAAAYAKRRTNPAAATPGPYLAIKAAFINARAAVTGGAACAAQRAEAFAAIRDQWERALLGTTIFYLNRAATTLDLAAPTETERAGALHQLGEAVGFLRGLRAVPASARQITDAQLDQALTTLGGMTLGGAASYTYVTDPAANVGKLAAVISQLQAARQFTSEEIALYKSAF